VNFIKRLLRLRLKEGSGKNSRHRMRMGILRSEETFWPPFGSYQMKLWFGNAASAAGASVKNMISLDASKIR